MALPPWFMDSARALIRADSVSAQGNQAALAVLEPLYVKAGLSTQRFSWRESIDGAPDSLHSNLLAGPGGGHAQGAMGGVLFVTHSDTVPTGPLERWTETGGDPRALTEKDGWLFGLGVADVKLDALCKIAAAERLLGKKLARPFWLCATAAEEVGLRGARRFAESAEFKALEIREVLCGEPSELQLIRAHKGYAVVVCTITDLNPPQVEKQAVRELAFEGKAAHSSTPHLGDNAIHRALQWAHEVGAPVLSADGGASANTVPALCTLLVPVASAEESHGANVHEVEASSGPDLLRAMQTAGALEELWISLVHKLLPASDPRFDPPGAVGGLNILKSIEEKAAPGATRGRATVRATMDARLLPQHDPETLLVTFMAAAEAWVQRTGRGELSLRVEITRNAGGMSLGDHAPLLVRVSDTLARLGLDPTAKAKPTSTEAGVFARAGCEAIVIGPGRSTGNAHTANERIEIAQLVRAVDLYESLLEDLCGRS